MIENGFVAVWTDEKSKIKPLILDWARSIFDSLALEHSPCSLGRNNSKHRSIFLDLYSIETFDRRDRLEDRSITNVSIERTSRSTLMASQRRIPSNTPVTESNQTVLERVQWISHTDVEAFLLFGKRSSELNERNGAHRILHFTRRTTPSRIRSLHVPVFQINIDGGVAVDAGWF